MKLSIYLVLIIMPFLTGAERILFSDKIMEDSITITEELMNESNIPIRDTWKGYDGYNWDDYFVNNEKFNGEKHISIVFKQNGRSEIHANTMYEVPECSSIAYDGFRIEVPKRLRKFKHPIIHELVHFLQKNTLAEEEKYVSYNGENYKEYVSQRTELEAHFIQLYYIRKNEIELIEINNKIKEMLVRKIDEAIENRKIWLEVILFAKNNGVI